MATGRDISSCRGTAWGECSIADAFPAETLGRSETQLRRVAGTNPLFPGTTDSVRFPGLAGMVRGYLAIPAGRAVVLSRRAALISHAYALILLAGVYMGTEVRLLQIKAVLFLGRSWRGHPEAGSWEMELWLSFEAQSLAITRGFERVEIYYGFSPGS
jgi:hypothetical protein